MICSRKFFLLKTCPNKTDCLHLPTKQNNLKKILFIALIAFGINAKAQIALEYKYQGGNAAFKYLRLVHFTSAGYKYRIIDRYNNVITIYNLNHSIYKTINVPTQISKYWDVYYLSDELFNTNPNDIEYILGNYNSNYIRIYEETGNLLFSKDSVEVGKFSTANIGQQIFYTPLGIKMILQNPFLNTDSSASVYSLPGKLSCNDCVNGSIGGITPYDGNGNEINISNSYPNPAINSTRIDYTFPSGVNEGEIVFYDLQGKELKRFKVDKTFDHLLISTADIPAGNYFFQLQTSNQASEGKKMVVIK